MVLQAVVLVAVLATSYVASQNVLLRFSETIAARIARDATAYTENFLDPAQEAGRGVVVLLRDTSMKLAVADEVSPQTLRQCLGQHVT